MAVKQGRELFLTGCSSCHGLNAQGGNQGPSLIGVGESAVIFQVSTGRMPLANPGPQAPRKDPVYTEAQIDQLAAYIGSLAPGPKLPPGDLTDGDLALGGELFRTNCAQCHNFAGSGGALTYGKKAPPLGEATPEQIYTAMQTGPNNMPVFGDNQLPPFEKRSIVKYVENLNNGGYKDPGGAPIGRTGPVSEGIVIWVVGAVAVVGLMLWIGARA
jgi:ubiquinol-cytochrome c reductase cytochrome c subunit